MITQEQIDTLGRLARIRARIEAREKALKDELKKQGAGFTYEGDRFIANVYSQERSTLDMDAAKKKLGDAWIAAHTKVTETISVIVKPRGDLVI